MEGSHSTIEPLRRRYVNVLYINMFQTERCISHTPDSEIVLSKLEDLGEYDRFKMRRDLLDSTGNSLTAL